jgi:purine-nucleoside phosphorylase
MSLHLEAQPGEIASSVLVAGDPHRVSHYAEKFLQERSCYNTIREMVGYTGIYQGKRVSIQATGIGMPSTALYMHELIHSYGAQCFIRVGTCGAIQPNIQLGQTIVATDSLSDSNITQHYSGVSVPDQGLLQAAMDFANRSKISLLKGTIFSTDVFYSSDVHRWDESIKRGVLAVEMETSLLYAMAAKFKIQALSLLSVSDHILTGEIVPAKEREVMMDEMMRVAFGIA